MIVNNLGNNSGLSVQTLIDMRNQLVDLQRQLGTGKRADNYAGLGLDRGLTIGLRSHLAAVNGYQQTITAVGVRLDLVHVALSQTDSIARDAKSTAMQSPYQLGGGDQTIDQKSAFVQFEQMLSILNTSTGGRYLFGGRSVDQPAVETADRVMNGFGTRAGFKQIVAERRLADLGASGLGRLVVTNSSATAVDIDEDAVSPFGFKLASAVSGLTGSTVTGPVGTPASLTVDLGATNPNAGETVRFTFTLPDGTSHDLVLTATASATPGANEFTIGGSSAVTRANLQTALTQSLDYLAKTQLAAASAMAAANDFFNIDDANPPQRVDGPPFDSATALIDGTNANTVTWYLGEDSGDAARSTAVARADQALTLSYGLRANEDGLRLAAQSIAAFAAVTFSPSDPDGEAQYAALRQRVTATLDGPPSTQRIADIQADMAAIHNALQSAKERHQQTTSTLGQFLQQVEGAPTEEVAAKILALQTSLQATLQTTAMLLRTNLLEYL
jgi:flagellin-like hook-associated protein FlgL